LIEKKELTAERIEEQSEMSGWSREREKGEREKIMTPMTELK
jgi:hypothetical protein